MFIFQGPSELMPPVRSDLHILFPFSLNLGPFTTSQRIGMNVCIIIYYAPMSAEHLTED